MHPTALAPSTAHLALPFFETAHRDIAARLPEWSNAQGVNETDDRAACRDWVRRMGADGWLRYCVSAEHGGALPQLDSRALKDAKASTIHASCACAMALNCWRPLGVSRTR